MRVGCGVFRAGLWLATTSLCLTSVAPAMAQPVAAQPGSGQPGSGQGNAGDPPTIAGRLSQVTGSVSFHTAAEQSWAAASQNYPVTAGDAFWTEQQAGAAIEVGSDLVVMDGATELDIGALDQQQFVASEPQGAVFLQLTQLPDGQGVTVNTPRAAVQITAVGRYEIVAGDTNDATTVTVLEGAAHVTGTGVALDVGPQQTGSIVGADQFQGSVGPIQQDGFLQAQLNRQAPQTANVPRQVQCMTGGSQLAQYGNWSQTSQYGQVWYPSNVPADWAPYRNGHWVNVAPWGWNWVDDQPWGFAPFHYGRWVQDGGRWGWVGAAPDAPYEPYPTYSPALVGFVDVGGAALAGFAAGALIGGAIGWVPLGFREPYYPSYHVSDGYLQRINRISVVNVRNITVNNYRNVDINRFANIRAATVMPARAMARSERVEGVGRPLAASGLAGARPVFGRSPVAPTPVRLGRPAPGPQFHGAPGLGGRPALRPAFLPPDMRRNDRIGVPSGTARPGLPPLRQPGGGRPDIPVRPSAGAGRPGGIDRAAGAPERAAPPASRPAAGREAPGRPALPAERPAAPEHRAPAAARPQSVHREAPAPRVQHPSAPVARPSFRQAPRPQPHAAPPRPQPHAAAPHPAPHPEQHPHPAAPEGRKH